MRRTVPARGGRSGGLVPPRIRDGATAATRTSDVDREAKAAVGGVSDTPS